MIPENPTPPCAIGDRQCRQEYLISNIAGVSCRTEYPDGLSGSANRWEYCRKRFLTPAPYQATEVRSPDGYAVRHYHHVDTQAIDPGEIPGNGLEYQTDILDLGGNVVRSQTFCYEGDLLAGGTSNNVCGVSGYYRDLQKNVRQSYRDESPIGSPSRKKKIIRSEWDGYGHFRQENTEDWDGGTLKLRRSVRTDWNANTTDWILGLYTKEMLTEGSSLVERFYDFESSKGFLQGIRTWDQPRNLVHGSCRYRELAGNVEQEFTAIAAGLSPCPGSMPAGVIGINNDAFGKRHTYLNGQPVTTRWLKWNPALGSNADLPWLSTNLTRDGATGAVRTSKDPSGISTSYQYDILGRPTNVTPGGEAASQIAYDSPTKSTVTRDGGGTGLQTWQRSLYDGFGRLVREIRQMPSGYSVRRHGYNSVGRQDFVSEWVACSPLATCETQAVTTGTSRSNFDPFGRPQAVTKADGSTVTISYADGSIPFSDLRTAETINNVNGTCSGGSCSGGVAARTDYLLDGLGRLTSVIEPTGNATSYQYDVQANLIQVTQTRSSVTQTRAFEYDDFGFLRSENTPEKGLVTYSDYGSLGNLRSRSEGGVLYELSYDAAGRLTEQKAAGTVYLTNLYDGNGFAGGANPLGKLTRRIGYNPLATPPSTVTENFTYSGLGGRLSQKAVSVSGAPQAITGTQTWTYNLLGLLATHGHPKANGSPDIVETVGYSNGLPASSTIPGATLVSGATYHPSGNLASWTAGNGVTTWTDQDTSGIPRPRRIYTSNSAFNTEIYVYDGAGNIRWIGPDRYDYDSLSRLTLSIVSGIQQNFPYDGFGNLTAFAAVSAATNRLSSGTYDNRGNLLSVSGNSYGYDLLSRQISFNGGTERYVYDGAGERIARVTGPPSGEKFFTLTPCRLLDTRQTNPPSPLGHGVVRSVAATGSCGIPSGATSVAGNLAVVTAAQGGVFRLSPGGTSPSTSTLNFSTGQTRANNFTMGLSADGRLDLLALSGTGSGTFNALIDVAGYFQRAVTAQTWNMTFRDEADRLSTDYAITSSSINRTKDYFYFGNLLIASRDSAGTRLFYHSDHLGTPRLVTKQDGTMQETHKYQPFGQEIAGNVGGFGNQPLKFALMERDVSSGGDYDHARYQSSAQGRFWSPDRLTGDPLRPQSWNRYAYALGNPLKYVDPNGLRPLDAQTRAFLEVYFGVDLARVRVHGGLFARILAGIGGGPAITFGQHIFFSRAGFSDYTARTDSGVALTGHEVTHTLQYDEEGFFGFLKQYISEYAALRRAGLNSYDAYNAIGFEIAANEQEKGILQFLRTNVDILEAIQMGVPLTQEQKSRIEAVRPKAKSGDMMRSPLEEFASKGLCDASNFACR